MTWYTNGTPFGQQVNEEELGQCDPARRQDNASVMVDHSLNDQMHWVPEPHYQSHTCDTSSWQNIAVDDPSLYGGVWPNDQHLDEIFLASLYGTSGSNVHELGSAVPMGSTMGSDIATEPDIDIPSTLGELHTAQFPLDWTHQSVQFTSSWVDPVPATVQHSDHCNFVGSGTMTPEISSFHLQSPPATAAGYRGYIDTHTGGSAVRSASSLSSVQPRDDSSPVSDASSTPTHTSASRPRGERWPLSNATTFRCMWKSHGMLCSAMIPGDRKSVSSHLRDVHDFTCDGRLMACQWGDCTACMQRRNIPRHIVTRHFEVRVKCPRCGLSMSRADANRKHQLACRGIGGGQSQSSASGGRSGNSDGAHRGSRGGVHRYDPQQDLGTYL